METKMERERSLKKLHFCIATYSPTDEENLAMKSAYVDLKEKTEMKFRKSAMNQSYVFPRKFHHQQQYSNSSEVVDLTHQNYSEETQQSTDLKPKLKIKLARPKNQNLAHIQQYHTSNLQNFKTDHNNYQNTKNYKGLSNQATALKDRFKTDYSASKENYLTNTSNGRIKTQYSASKENNFTNAIKIADYEVSTHGSLERTASGQRSKSKLNLLTKSYMNLKSSLLNNQKTQQITCNTIRSNDYKFMPNRNQQRCITQKPTALAQSSKNKWQQCKSSRLLNNCSTRVGLNMQKINHQKNQNHQSSIQKQHPLLKNQRTNIKLK